MTHSYDKKYQLTYHPETYHYSTISFQQMLFHIIKSEISDCDDITFSYFTIVDDFCNDVIITWSTSN